MTPCSENMPVYSHRVTVAVKMTLPNRVTSRPRV